MYTVIGYLLEGVSKRFHIFLKFHADVMVTISHN